MSNPKDDIFSLLGRIFFKHHFEDGPGGLNNPPKGETKAMLATIGILAFVGNEAVKILFRKNFSMSRMDWVKYGLCVICFGVISVISFYCMDSTEDFATGSASPDAHFVSGIIFAILAITILVKGLKDADKSASDNYSGDSNVLRFLMKDGWSERKIQNLAEPLLVLTLGIAYCPYDLFVGIAAMFCAISVWGNAVFDKLFPDNTMEDDSNRLNASHKKRPNFNRAKID